MKLNFCSPENVTIHTNILDIEVPEELKHTIKSGIPEVDDLLGGEGITPSSVVLITGSGGSGKSTLMLTLANSLTAQNNVCLYNTAEESLFQVRKTIDRLGLTHGFIPGAQTDVMELIKTAEEIKNNNPTKKLVVFIDSLQCLEIPREEGKRGRSLGQQNKAKEALEILCSWAKKTFVPVFVIGHVNKSGAFEGKETLKHIIDVYLHLDFDKDKKSITYGMRTIEVKKNRFGPSGKEETYTLEKDGFKFGGTNNNTNNNVNYNADLTDDNNFDDDATFSMMGQA